jgi:5-(carboxyamino)imidazole ribonucleotide synthase
MGGGQLGRMFTTAAQSMGYRVCVLDPDGESPAGRIADRHLHAGYLDAQALAEMGALCGAVTTEFENVPAEALATLARYCRVTPRSEAVAIAQDRIAEKEFIAACGVATAPFATVRDVSDLQALAHRGPGDAGLSDAGLSSASLSSASLFPGILKVARLGYDGKGQARVATLADTVAAFERFSRERGAGGGAVDCVLERQLELACEISVVVARADDGSSVTFPVGQNVHRDGILASTTVPAAIDASLADRARRDAMTIAGKLRYVGVLCVEFFVLRDGTLVANEMAPRPHNSGHWSIEAAITSQFEQQARIMAGLPLGSTDLLSPAVMLNILGDAWFPEPTGNAGASLPSHHGEPREPDWAALLSVPGTSLHLYGKSEARLGRKMGHVTVVAPTSDEARRRALDVAPLIRQQP